MNSIDRCYNKADINTSKILMSLEILNKYHNERI